MNQLAEVPFGTNRNVWAGYAQSANDRLGTFTLVVENTGDKTLNFVAKKYDGTTAPSGFVPIGTAMTIVPGGSQTQTYTIVDKKLGFFGSGNTATDLSGTAASTKARLSIVIPSKSSLTGAQIDIVTSGHRGWGYDEGFDKRTTSKKWGPAPDFPSEPLPSGGGGYTGGGNI